MLDKPGPIKGKGVWIIFGMLLIVTGFIGIDTLPRYFGQARESLSQQNIRTEPSKSNTTKAKPIPKNSIAPVPKKRITAAILVVDQSGKPVVNARVWFSDDEGKKWPVAQSFWSADYWSTNEAGAVCCWEYGDRKELGEEVYMPAKTYTIHISKDNYDVIEAKTDYSISDAEKSVSFAPSKFVLRKWSTLSAVIIDSSGKPIGKPIQNVDGYGGSFSLVDAQGRKYGQNTARYDRSTGRLEIGPVPDGQYTLHIESAYDYTYDRAIIEYAPIDQAVQVSGSDIFLGRITLSKK